MGGFTVINGPPGAGGVWNSTISGAWAPAATYGRWLPTLSRVANSFYVSGPYAGYYAHNNMSNLAFFHQRPGAYGGAYGSPGAWQAQQMMMRDNTGSRWDDSQRGNVNWITQMEGGSMYHGGAYPRGAYPGGMPYDYVMFNGGRSKLPSETMRELNNSEMQQILMH